MKTLILAIFLMVLFFACDNDESPLEGSWKLINAQVISDGAVTLKMPGDYNGNQIKVWSDESFACVGKFQNDTLTINNFAAGSYKLNGSLYEESIQFHADEKAVNKTIKMEVEFRGDTLLQKWPADKDGKIDLKNYRMEKYIRID